jgi:hypothetical protein
VRGHPVQCAGLVDRHDRPVVGLRRPRITALGDKPRGAAAGRDRVEVAVALEDDRVRPRGRGHEQEHGERQPEASTRRYRSALVRVP